MSKVSAAKPGVGGGVFVAPKGTALPTDATTALAAAYKSVGYISDEGVTKSTSLETSPVHAWGGDMVAMLGQSKTETFRFRCLELDNLDALGLCYGQATGNLSDGIVIKSTTDVFTPRTFVLSTLLDDGVVQRVVIPSGVVSAVGDVQYVGSAVLSCEVTITAIADSSGVASYDYRKTAAAPVTT